MVDDVYLERGEQLRICMAGDGADGDGKQIIERMIPVAETPFDTNYFFMFLPGKHAMQYLTIYFLHVPLLLWPILFQSQSGLSRYAPPPLLREEMDGDDAQAPPLLLFFPHVWAEG